MKLIIYPGVDIWDFVLSGLNGRSDVLLFPLNRNSNLFQKVSRKLGNGLSLPPSFIMGTELLNSLQSLSVGDAVILAEYREVYNYAIFKVTRFNVCLFNSSGIHYGAGGVVA